MKLTRNGLLFALLLGPGMTICHATEAELEEAQAKIAVLEQENQELKAELEALEQEVTELQQALDSHEVDRLKSGLELETGQD